MSGVLGAVLGSHSFSRHVVTIGQNGNFAGFSEDVLNPAFGSITPPSSRGASFHNLFSRSSADLQIWLNGGFAQNLFYSITIEAGNGSTRTYTTASADLYQNQSGIFTLWGWGLGSNRVWEVADDTEQHWLIIRY